MLTLEIRKPRCIQWRTTNGFSHNLLNPTLTSWHKNGQKYCESYYLNDKYHRDPTLGPATIRWYGNGQKYSVTYYVNNKCHRDPNLGPAHTRWDSDGQKYYEHYYVNGEQVSKPC